MRRVPPILKIVVGIVLLAGIGSAAKSAISPGPPAACVYSCSRPPAGVPQPAGNVLNRPDEGFSFTYPSRAKVVGRSGPMTTLNFSDSDGSFDAQLAITAGNGAPPLSSLISHAASALDGTQIANLQRTGPMPGAEVGFVPGDGAMYEGEYSDSSGYQYPVKIGILAAEHRRRWVSLVGISTESASDRTPLSFGVFDDILARWRWTS
jgi:hypothetical protein